MPGTQWPIRGGSSRKAVLLRKPTNATYPVNQPLPNLLPFLNLKLNLFLKISLLTHSYRIAFFILWKNRDVLQMRLAGCQDICFWKTKQALFWERFRLT